METTPKPPYRPAPYPDIHFRIILYHGHGQLWIARLLEGANHLTAELISNTSPQAAEDLHLLAEKFRGLAEIIPGWHAKMHDPVVTRTKIAGMFRAHRGNTPIATYEVQRKIAMLIRQVAHAQAEFSGPEYFTIEGSGGIEEEWWSQPHFIPRPTKAKISALPGTPTFRPPCRFGPGRHNDLCFRDPGPADELFPDNWSLLHHSLAGHPNPSYEGHNSLTLPTHHPLRSTRPIRPTVACPTITRPAGPHPKPTPTSTAFRALIGYPPKPVSTAKYTTTVYVEKPFDLGPTSTAYASTSTSISQVPCGGCTLATINRGGTGPVVHFTTTVTIQQTKTVDVVHCSPQPGSN